MKKKIKLTDKQKKMVKQALDNLNNFFKNVEDALAIKDESSKKLRNGLSSGCGISLKKRAKKIPETIKKKMRDQAVHRVLNPLPAREITYKGNVYVLKSSIPQNSPSSSGRYDEEARIMSDHQILNDAKEFIRSNSNNDWSNDRR
jgi:hypothetical protein